MRGNSGKNIYSQVLPHTLAQMDTAKAHTHIAMRCELTAVFPCFISCGNFVSSTESCRSIYYISRCKDTANRTKSQKYLDFSEMQPIFETSLRDNGNLSRIQRFAIFLWTHNISRINIIHQRFISFKISGLKNCFSGPIIACHFKQRKHSYTHAL